MAGSQLAAVPAASVSILKNAEMLELDPHTIDVSGRIGFFFPDKAAAFASLLPADGQRVPILVSRQPEGAELPWRLHVGLHRTMGTRLAGISVYGLAVTGTPEQLLELEASENIQRRKIEPIERAKFVFHVCEAARIRIAREHGDLKQQQLAIRARWARVRTGESRAEEALQDEGNDTADNLSAVYGWQESAAEALEMGPRDIRRSLEIYRLVIEPFPDLAEPLAHHPVVGTNASDLRRIAQVQRESDRRKVIEALLADPEIGADDARILAGVDRPAGPTPPAYQKHFNAIEGGWSRLGRGERTRFLRDKLVPLLTPGEKRELRDRLNEELGDA